MEALHAPEHHSHNGDYPPWTSASELIANVREIMKDLRTAYHSHTPEITFESPTIANGIWAMTGVSLWYQGDQEHWFSPPAITSRHTRSAMVIGFSPVAGWSTSLARLRQTASSRRRRVADECHRTSGQRSSAIVYIYMIFCNAGALCEFAIRVQRRYR